MLTPEELMLPRYDGEIFFLYRHIRLDSGMPFYIGIGKVCNHYGFDRSYFARAFSKKGRNNHWHSIVTKYGYEVEVLYTSSSKDEIFNKEVEFIHLYGRRDNNTGILINRTDGKDGNFSKERLQKISLAHKGKVISKETRLKISISTRGKKMSEETKKLLSVLKSGKSVSEKTLLASALKRKRSVIQFDKNGLIIKKWDSAASVSKLLKIDRGDIAKCCKGKIKSAGGFKWEYFL